MEAGETRAAGRRCIAVGCATVLSIYNSDHLCFAHADEATRARFESRWSSRTSPAWYHQARNPGPASAAPTS